MYFKYFKIVSKYGITSQEEIKNGNQVKAQKLFKSRRNQRRISSQSKEVNFSKSRANLGM